jgi:formate--tetrahydrofolate ligase
MLSDLEIAQAAELEPILDVAARLGIPPEAVSPYGRDKAKIDLDWLAALPPNPDARLILVTAITPTPPGEGKTTTSVGLADALQRLGRRSAVCLREPSLGPVFGMKGGAAGGGYAQVVPMEDINLHFTGDFGAVAAATNLLAALIDNHVHHGNELAIDVRRITWRRVVDINDRALREVTVGLGGPANGYPREDGFDIVVASEVMAVFCLATSIADLRERLGDIVVAYTRERAPIRARDLRAEGALAPNLVQTLEHTPAFIHGGPFANIAHGANSVIATQAAMHLADYVVTEAGFGADLGAEKFVDIVCRSSGLRPRAAVLVATVRALKYHGGADPADLTTEDLNALEIGLANLGRHVANLREVFGLPVVVAVNRFTSDSDAELELLTDRSRQMGVRVALATHWADGGAGAVDVAHEVIAACEEPSTLTFAYPDDDSLRHKMERVAVGTYGASEVTADTKVRRQLRELQEQGYGHLPICIAKTQASFSTDPQRRNAPSGHSVNIREVRLAAGARFIVLVCGDILTMPGLPTHPASEGIDVVDGRVVGLF